MNILLVASSLKSEGGKLLKLITEILQSHENIRVKSLFLDDLPLSPNTQNIDFVISIGGDGFLLMLAHLLNLPLPPFAGINIGSLGFLTEIAATQAVVAIEELITGKYEKTSRLVLEGAYLSSENRSNSKKSFAINECTIHRGSQPNLIDVAIHVDGSYLNTFSCDGLIIATPSGSTAYSLAAGGPIVTPYLDAVIITPICAHTISNRPIVLLPKKSITLEYVRGTAHADISFDGQDSFSIELHHKIELSVSSHRFITLSPTSTADYFHTIRSKLGWAGSLRQ